MAITIIASSPQISPGYAPVKYILDSNNKTAPGFRYLVQVFPAGGTVTLFTKRYPPRPTDGYAEVDISKDISSYVSFTTPFTNTNVTNSVESIYRYDIKFGEEYVTTWPFNAWGPTGPSASQYSYIGGTTSHGYTAGDQLFVTLSTGTFSTLPGLQTVYGAPGATTVPLNIPFTGTGTPSGTVKYADNRKTQYAGLTAMSTRAVINSTLTLPQLSGYTGASAYSMGTASPGKFLTNQPRTTLRAALDQEFYTNWYNGYVTKQYRLFFKNSANEYFYYPFTLSNTVGIAQQVTGPAVWSAGTLTGLTGLSGAVLPIAKAVTEFVDVYLADSSNNVLSETLRYNIDRRCGPNTHQILFLDRSGSFSSFSFPMVSDKASNVTRATYDKKFGSYSGANITYNTYDKGETVFDSKVDSVYTLNSQYMNSDELAYYEEMISSPVTFFKLAGQWQACTVQDTSVTTTTPKKLAQRTCQVKLAVATNMNY